ncbi:hypothetical protein [Streptomyces macrosporus]|uniref:Uncharacterized protein n=1 Tax=Streptomyces macrosporus TaxID=44032 RepID=A0ABN3JM42_9ACTN
MLSVVNGDGTTPNGSSIDEIVREGARRMSDAALEQARVSLEGDEPKTSRYPMLRRRLGAGEAVDDALSLLTRMV